VGRGTIKSIIKCLLTMVFLLLLIAGGVQASQGGVTDQDFDLGDKKQTDTGQCGVGCHQSTAGGAISITVYPAGPYTPSQSGINITITTSSVPGTKT
jgi:hypothetical protein